MYIHIYIRPNILSMISSVSGMRSAEQWGMTHIYIGWLWLVGSLKLYFSFAKEPYQRDYILQTRRMIWRSLLIVAAPGAYVYVYMYICTCISVYRTDSFIGGMKYPHVTSPILYTYIYVHMNEFRTKDSINEVFVCDISVQFRTNPGWHAELRNHYKWKEVSLCDITHSTRAYICTH